jgi:hypothetical protein
MRCMKRISFPAHVENNLVGSDVGWICTHEEETIKKEGHDKHRALCIHVYKDYTPMSWIERY